MQRIVYAGGKGQEQRAGVLQEKERSGRERQVKEKGRPTYLQRAKERSGTGSEASQRRQDRRRQPAITSWNVWERVGLDPKGPATTKSLIPPSPIPHPPSNVLPFSLSSLDFHQRLFREAPTLYKVTPGICRDYLIAWLDRRDHIAYLIHERHWREMCDIH